MRKDEHSLNVEMGTHSSSSVPSAMIDLIKNMEPTWNRYPICTCLPIHRPQYVENGPDADLLALVDVDAVGVDLLGDDFDV